MPDVNSRQSKFTVADLQHLLSPDGTNLLVNTYRGIPIESSASVLEVNPDFTIFNVRRMQILCIRYDGFTFIKSNRLPALLKARVKEWDWQAETITLSDFEYTSVPIGQRALLRVETSQPVPASLRIWGGRATYRSEVMEISPQGLTLYVHKGFFKSNIFRKGKRIAVNFLLPAKSSPISIVLQGIVRNITPGYGKQYYRLGIHTT